METFQNGNVSSLRNCKTSSSFFFVLFMERLLRSHWRGQHNWNQSSRRLSHVKLISPTSCTGGGDMLVTVAMSKFCRLADFFSTVFHARVCLKGSHG